jgi:hypothetical protein
VLNISCDISGPLAGIDELLGNDLPFTIARFLTLQAQSGQAAARGGERGIFKLRNDWTTRNTKITPATKETLLSEVYTDTSNSKTGAPDYLPRQQTGGERVPVAGHTFLAIPTRYLRKIAPGVIPKALRPVSLLPANAVLGMQYSGKFGRVGKASTPYPRTRRQDAALGNGDFIAFAQTTRSGTLCIFVRHGGIDYHSGSRDAEPWYVLAREAHLKSIFPMEEIVEKAVAADMEKNFDRAAAEVLVNNALKNGFRVKF